jgi:hypothetical protein
MGSKTSVNVPGPTAQEQQLTAKQVELAQAQLDAIKAQTEQQKLFGQQTGDLVALQTDLLKRSVALDEENVKKAQEMEPIQKEIFDRQLEVLRRGGAASPEELGLISDATNSAIASGTSDIDAFQRDAVLKLRNELAGSLGLRPTDTPIIDRAGEIAKEGARQQGKLVTDLRGAEAQAKLNFPLARDQLIAGVANSAGQLQLATEEFKANLRESALINRLNFANAAGAPAFQTAQLGLGLATGIPGASSLASASNNLLQSRLANTTTRTSNGLGFLSAAGPLLSGVGGLMSGLSATGVLGTAAVASSRDWKEDFGPVDEEAILAGFRSLPVSIWRYLWDDETDTHIGPMAQDVQTKLGFGDGTTIPIIDALGSLFAATSALARRMEAVKANDDEGEKPAARLGLDASPRAAPRPPATLTLDRDDEAHTQAPPARLGFAA